MEMSSAMMVTTTSTSMSVKALRRGYMCLPLDFYPCQAVQTKETRIRRGSHTTGSSPPTSIGPQRKCRAAQTSRRASAGGHQARSREQQHQPSRFRCDAQVVEQKRRVRVARGIKADAGEERSPGRTCRPIERNRTIQGEIVAEPANIKR